MKEQLQNIKEQALKTIGDCVDVTDMNCELMFPGTLNTPG